MNARASSTSSLLALLSPLALVLIALLAVFACSGDDDGSAGEIAAGWREPVDPRLETILAAYDGLERPDVNVLLISLDSVRKDFLSCYGHVPRLAPEEKTSPNLDRMAAEGVLFEQFHSNTSWTLPSHISMMSGQPELVHGVEIDHFTLHPSFPTIASVLGRLGYLTAGFYTGPYCHDRFGTGNGMEIYEDAYGSELAELNAQRVPLQVDFDAIIQRMADEPDPNEKNRILGEADAFRSELVALDRRIDTMSHKDISSKVLTDKTLATIETAETEGRPWFVFAHYFDPHYDYIPPPEFEKRFDPDYTGVIDGKRFFHNENIGKRIADPRLTLRRQVCSDRDLDHILALYEAEIAFTDSELGRLFETLRQRGTLDKTLVIITADHGDEFFEHGGIGHRSTLFQEQLAVPMVMRLPGALPHGARVKGLASHVDIFPTVLDVLGVPQPDVVRGRSMLPLATGESDGSDRFVMGRLVQAHPLTNIGGPKVYRNTVKEVFYTGDLKLFRWRRWPWPMPDCPETRAVKVRATAEEKRAADAKLAWVDLSKTPGEQEADFQSEFTDPRAAAALEQFRAYYAELSSDDHPTARSFGGKAAYLWRQIPQLQKMADDLRKSWLVPPPGQ